MSDTILELKNITKIFPGVKALDNVHFQLKQGEIHALMGENGAGKSTFIKVITGVHPPDGGEMYLNGEQVVFSNPKDAQNHSIAAIYQHGTVYPHMSVTENIFLGHEKIHPVTKFILWNQMHKDAGELLEKLGSDIDPRVSMGNLSVAEQQVVEIAKAISTNAKIIIMDEPTAALSNRECEQLYKITLKLQSEGASIIFISHRFEDMYRLAGRVTVFRDAKYIGTWGVDEISNDKLISAMVGREITQIYPKIEAKIGAELLRVENIGRTGYFKDVSFRVRKGEIFALTGLVGAGRSEVCQTLFGIEKAEEGKILLEGKELRLRHPQDAMDAGVGYLPEDRQRQGLILEWEIYKNETLATLEQFTKHTAIDTRAERNKAKTLSERISVKAVSVYDKVSSLSGGNQQKVIFAKLLNSDLKLIILDEPTKGVDVGAKSQIYEIMCKLAQDGYGIIMVSSEMPEVLGVADTIGVMRTGRMTAIFDRKEATQEKILAAAMQVNGGETGEG